ncbi:winged helix-turn-helix domain-containing protein [Methyloligella solikamskensis]|uniref:Winged helix-turn-helix domain-containing protein n=1 Tax=Methyloligella solikamskensis TaxID=1177756 RepID=A0ABW3J9A8_9HYPH
MSRERSAPYAYEGLDRVIHEKARLGILTSLIGHPKGLSFGDLKRLCGLTDGNLSRHLQVLEETGLVQIDKRFEGKRPLTTCRLTPAGRERFLDYVAELERVVRDAADVSARVDNDPMLKPRGA